MWEAELARLSENFPCERMLMTLGLNQANNMKADNVDGHAIHGGAVGAVVLEPAVHQCAQQRLLVGKVRLQGTQVPLVSIAFTWLTR